jgi:hypothetical protein
MTSREKGGVGGRRRVGGWVVEVERVGGWVVEVERVGGTGTVTNKRGVRDTQLEKNNYSNRIKCCNILQSRETPTWEENIRNSRTGVVILVSKV